jgi:hypothetical protein
LSGEVAKGSAKEKGRVRTRGVFGFKMSAPSEPAIEMWMGISKPPVREDELVEEEVKVRLEDRPPRPPTKWNKNC